jgi:hypothetical protein
MRALARTWQVVKWRVGRKGAQRHQAATRGVQTLCCDFECLVFDRNKYLMMMMTVRTGPTSTSTDGDAGGSSLSYCAAAVSWLRDADECSNDCCLLLLVCLEEWPEAPVVWRQALGQPPALRDVDLHTTLF